MPNAAPTHKRHQIQGHSVHRPKRHRPKREKTAAQSLYTYAWQQFSKAWMRSNPLCLYCETQGRIKLAQMVDHIEPHRGDVEVFWQDDNFASCCRACHNGPKARAENYADKTGNNIRDVLRDRGMLL